jgi:hypothetical protein
MELLLCMMRTTDWIYIQKGAWKIQIEKAHTIPLTQSGKAFIQCYEYYAGCISWLFTRLYGG